MEVMQDKSIKYEPILKSVKPKETNYGSFLKSFKINSIFKHNTNKKVMVIFPKK